MEGAMRVSRIHDLARLAEAARVALSVGRSVEKWQRDSFRHASRLGRLKWSGAWIEAMFAVEPWLCRGPLFGDCLTEVADARSFLDPLTHEADKPTRQVGRRHDAIGSGGSMDRARNHQFGTRRFNIPPTSTPSGERESIPSSQASSQRHGATPESPSGVLKERNSRSPRSISFPTHFPTHAGSSLLSRLVGGLEQLSRSELEPRPPKVSPKIPIAATRPDRTMQVSTGSGSGRVNTSSGRHSLDETDRLEGSGSHLSPTSNRVWRDNLFARTESAIRRALRQSPHPRPDAAERSGLALNELWSLGLGGQPAPIDLLNNLYRKVGRERDLHRAVTGSREIHSPHADARETRSTTGTHASATDQEPFDVPSYTRFDAMLRAGVGSDDFNLDLQRSSQIAPPAISSSLPALLPPRAKDQEPLPIAAAMARHGARVEAATAYEDLDELAARIKSILDEQARRHGIDV